MHQITNGPHSVLMDVLGRQHSFAMYLGAVGSDHDAFDLGPAEINPDPEIVEHSVHRPAGLHTTKVDGSLLRDSLHCTEKDTM
jgi:hypothetical protein